MNVQELIDALLKQDPNAPARDGVKAVNADAEKDALARVVTPAGIRERHARNHDHAKCHKDSKGNGNENPDLCAYQATRSDVFAALQFANPPPPPDPKDEGDAELHHASQKRHNIKLWKQVDTLIAAAGVTAKGLVS